jgi:hypothetical protein
LDGALPGHRDGSHANGSPAPCYRQRVLARQREGDMAIVVAFRWRATGGTPERTTSRRLTNPRNWSPLEGPTSPNRKSYTPTGVGSDHRRTSGAVRLRNTSSSFDFTPPS